MIKFIEKKTGRVWVSLGFTTDGEIRIYRFSPLDSLEEPAREELKLTENLVLSVFNLENREPIVCIEQLKAFEKKQIHKEGTGYFAAQIILKCPYCGNMLKPEGGALLSYPVQYDHKCSNPECNYYTRTRSYYSGDCVYITYPIALKVLNGTYDEIKDGEIDL